MKIAIDQLKWFGRTTDKDGVRYFDYSASGFCFVFKGKRAVTTILSNPEKYDDNGKGVIAVYVSDGADTTWASFPEEPTYRYQLKDKVNECLLFESEEEKTVTIRVLRLSEAVYGYSGLKQLEVEGQLLPETAEDKKLKLEIIGDSITCGYGIEGVYGKDVFTTMQERPDKAYAFLTAKELNADYNLISRSGNGLISAYTDPATVKLPNHAEPMMSQLWPYTDRYLSANLGIEPEVWDESRFAPDVVILHLGTNDASWVRGLEDRRLSFVNLYTQMLERIHLRSPKAKIVCCLGAMGQDLCDSVEEALIRFNKDFPSVPTKYVKFPVQDEKNDDVVTDWHPSAKTHKKMAAQLSAAIKNW